MTTSIEWTDNSWNPLRARRADDDKTGWHCEKVSTGCANCYAETFNHRRLPGGGTGLPYTRRSRDAVETYLDAAVLVQPLRWRKPRRVFVCSMTDLFGEWVTDEQIDRVFAVMALAQQHVYQVLTKRPERMLAWASRSDVCERIVATAARRDAPLDLIMAKVRGVEPQPWPLANVWLGTSCEDQATADERIPHLLLTPAAVRFVSAEPLLGPIDISGPLDRAHLEPDAAAGVDWIVGEISWVIVGGESGPGARPMDPRWARSLRDQCVAARVPFFFKQWGGTNKKRAGRLLDGRVWDEMPAVTRSVGARS